MDMNDKTPQNNNQIKLKKWRIAAKFVPRLLHNDQRDHQVQLYTELQEAARHDPNFLSRVITGDDHGCMFMSRYDNSIWKFIKSLRKPTLVSPPLRLETPTQERKTKSNSIRETPNGRIPTTPALYWRRNTWIPRITRSISRTLKTNHAKGNKGRIKTLKYEKKPGMDLITPKMIMELTQKDMILYYLTQHLCIRRTKLDSLNTLSPGLLSH